MADLHPGMKYWCERLHRYLWYIGENRNSDGYDFEDAGDIRITLDRAEAENLNHSTRRV